MRIPICLYSKNVLSRSSHAYIAFVTVNKRKKIPSIKCVQKVKT